MSDFCEIHPRYTGPESDSVVWQLEQLVTDQEVLDSFPALKIFLCQIHHFFEKKTC